MSVTVLCPQCDELSRVPSQVQGEYVRCPYCEHPFRAFAYDDRNGDVPTLRQARTASLDNPPDSDESAQEAWNGRASSFLVGLSLLPFSVPVLWLLGPLLTGKDTIFSIGLPVAIAMAATGLSLGVVFAADWSYATRLKGIFVIVFVSYFLAGFSYFLKTEWLEKLRNWPVAAERWPKFRPPNHLFSIDMPQQPEPQDLPLVGEWALTSYRAMGRGRQQNDMFVLAHGRPPDDVIDLGNEAFFERVKSGVVKAANGEITTESLTNNSNRVGHEYIVTMPGQTRRIVQVYRLGEQVVVVAAEGAFLTKDAPDVTRFFKSLALVPTKK